MRHGSHIDPRNRFERTHAERDWEQLEWDQEYLRQVERRETEYLSDASKSIVSENRSPDIPFRFSLNPYRGCAHGCSYCYARPTHEYLGFNAGLDFETKVIVKHDAPRLFRDFLARDSWAPESISFSGVTDCYQPAERAFRLTRQCLEVALQCRQPVSIITKNALILRDLDLLQAMAPLRLIHVYVSITTLEPQLARDMEPRTSIPAARLRAVETLVAASVPVGVMMAPVIPGLTDTEIPAVLKAARAAGATAANYVMLRLPLTVEEVFREWLQRARPLQAEKVLGLIRDARAGQLNSTTFGDRMTGTGERAEQIRKLFRLFKQQCRLDDTLPPQDASQFRPPPPASGQMRLFD